MRVAVIGSGISGSLIARILHSRHEVVLYEAADYPGGHAHTHSLRLEGRPITVDTGFMVFNDRTYPNFCRLLELLGVQSQPSDMSFSVSCPIQNFEYQGSSLDGLFAQRGNLLRPSFYRLLVDILRFNQLGTAAVATGSIEPASRSVSFSSGCGLTAIDRSLSGADDLGYLVRPRRRCSNSGPVLARFLSQSWVDAASPSASVANDPGWFAAICAAIAGAAG